MLKFTKYLLNAFWLLLLGSLTLSPGSAVAQVVVTPGGPQMLSAGVPLTLSAPPGYATYTWTRNNVTPVGTGSTCTVTQPGFYRVRVTAAGNAVNTSAAVRVLQAVAQPERVGKTYVYEQTVRQEGVTDLAQLTADVPTLQAIRYADALGRATQEIGISASPLRRNMVLWHEYDAIGRETRSYLPYTVAAPDDRLRANPLAEQQQFYSATPKVASSATGPAFSEVVVDDSPFNRVVEQGAVGASWQIQRDASGASTFGGHTTKARTRVCACAPTEQVALWQYTNVSEAAGLTGTASFQLANPGQLVVQETLDEEGRLTQVFRNTLGQVVAQRNVVPGATGTDNPTTAYAYDPVGRLLLALTPEGVKRAVAQGAALDTAFLGRWAYLFTYDVRGRQNGRKTPGSGWIYTVYDNWDRPVATQRPDQHTGLNANTPQWTFTKYDELNRPIVTGSYHNAGTRASLERDASGNNTALPIAHHETSRYATQLPGTTIGYTVNRSCPVLRQPAQEEFLTVSYYDTYQFAQEQFPDLAYTQESPDVEVPSPANPSGRTLGARTAGQTRILGTNDWLASATYFDEEGRPLQTQAQNHRHGLDRFTTEYDFGGNVLKTYQHHTVVDATPTTPGNQRHSIRYRYTYDGGERPISTFARFDDIHGNKREVLLSTKEYNELGQLVDEKLGGFQWPIAKLGGAGRYLQSVDYRYNLRGQLEKINNRDLSGRSRRRDTWQLQGAPSGLGSHTPNDDPDAYADLFGLELEYDRDHTGAHTGVYDGSISALLWRSRTPGNDNLRRYTYDYDPLSRLTAAHYSAYDYRGGAGWNLEKDDANGAGRFTTDGLTYDLNGNLQTLNRVGRRHPDGTGPAPFGPIDQLKYGYLGNKLLTVTDAAGSSEAPNDFEDNTQLAQEYGYDKSGNLTRDKNKGAWPSYNVLGLLSAVQFGGGNPPHYLTLTHTASGRKIKQQYHDATAHPDDQHVDYIAGFTYGQGELLTVATPTGRALYVPDRPEADQWVQEYHLRDHQGSLRVAFRAGGTDLLAKASMEPGASQQEEDQFEHLADTRTYDPDHARTGTHSAKLNAAYHYQGPTARLDVKAGDSLHIEVFGKYDEPIVPLLRPRLLPTLVGAGGALRPRGSLEVQAGPGRPNLWQRLAAGLTLTFSGLLAHRPDSATAPEAFVCYDLYTTDSVWVKSAYQPLTPAAEGEWEHLNLSLTADSSGYVEVSVQNYSAKNVWFDDVRVVTVEEMLVQENHYDPWGQNLPELETTGKPEHLGQYTGKERLREGGLEWADFGARHYDAQLGRWHAQDPASQYGSPYLAMGNSPVVNVDPDGRFAFAPLLIGAAIGAVMSSGIYAASARGNFTWSGLGRAAAIGAVGGALGAGLGAAGAGLGTFGQSMGYNVMTNVGASSATNLAFGNEVTWSTVAGSVAGSLVGAGIGGYTGVTGGGTVANIAGELAFNTTKYAATGAVAGGVAAAIDGRDIAAGAFAGAAAGARTGATLTALNVGLMGPTYVPEKMRSHYGRLGAPVFRKGWLGKPGDGVTIGRNLITSLHEDNEKENTYMQAHEYYHYVQQRSLGFVEFYKQTIYSYLFNPGFSRVYSTPGTLEYRADFFGRSISTAFYP